MEPDLVTDLPTRIEAGPASRELDATTFPPCRLCKTSVHCIYSGFCLKFGFPLSIHARATRETDGE
jgi:hypothetical protein